MRQKSAVCKSGEIASDQDVVTGWCRRLESQIARRPALMPGLGYFNLKSTVTIEIVLTSPRTAAESGLVSGSWRQAAITPA